MGYIEFSKLISKPIKQNDEAKKSDEEKSRWFYLDKTKQDVDSFLDMFYGFHDWQIFKINYHAEKNKIDVILKYSSEGLYVALRFINVSDVNFVRTLDFGTDYIWGTELYIDAQGDFVWCSTDEYEKEKGLPDYAVWVKSQKFHFAVIDKDYNTFEIPEGILNQKWEYEDGSNEEFHFVPKPVPKKEIL